jgi:hypothetical protein
MEDRTAGIVMALGVSSRKSSIRLATKSVAKKLTPVTLPPGRWRLETNPFYNQGIVVGIDTALCGLRERGHVKFGVLQNRKLDAGRQSFIKWQNEPKFNLKQSHICFRAIRAGSEIP